MTTVAQRHRRSRPTYLDLIETKTCLQKLLAQQPKAAGHLSAWVRHRRSTIETVDRLRKQMDDVCVGVNVAKGVGAAVGIGGALAGLAGLFLDFKGDHEAAEDFKKASKYCAGASIATMGLSTLVELGLSQSALNEIKRVVQKDIELTRPLADWIQFSYEVSNRFNQLFDCNLVSDTFHSVWNVFRQCMKLLDSGSTTVEGLISNLCRLKLEGIENLTMEISDKVIHFLKEMLNPELRQPLTEIWNILNDNPYTFEFVKVGAIIYIKTIDILKSDTNLPMLLSTVGISLPTIPKYALNVISLVSNVVTLILAVQNIQDGASKYSESLKTLKAVLNSELREVSKQLQQFRALSLSTDWENCLEWCSTTTFGNSLDLFY